MTHTNLNEESLIADGVINNSNIAREVLLVYIHAEEEPTSNGQFTLDVQESIDGVNDEMENENNDREVDAGLANIAVEPEKEKRTGQGLEQDQLMEDDVVGENMSPMEGTSTNNGGWRSNGNSKVTKPPGSGERIKSFK